MNATFAFANHLAAAGVANLLNTFWLAAVVVALAALALPRVPRINAATRYWIWMAVLAFILVLPFLPGLTGRAERIFAASARPTAPAVAGTTPLARVPAPPPAVAPKVAPIVLTVGGSPGVNPWPLWLLAVWIVAAGWQLARLLAGVESVRRLKARATSEGVMELPAISHHRRAGMAPRPVRLMSSDEVTSPVAVGYLHPAVIVPRGLLARLEPAERQDVLLHEIAHLRRHDDWMVVATRFLAALLALHPLRAFVLARIEREREMACDDFVIARTGAPGGYVRSLARLHDLRCATGRTRLLAPALLGQNCSLTERMESVLRHGRDFSERLSWLRLGIGTGLLLLLLAAGGAMPNWLAVAQTTARKAFDAASVKPGNPRDSMKHMLRIEPGGRFSATDIPLQMLIEYAYHLKSNQLEGLPAWASSRQYSIEAVPPPDTPKLSLEQTSDLDREMMQSLLADRFGLKVHRVTKQLPVYELKVAKGGPKMKPATAEELAPVPGFKGDRAPRMTAPAPRPEDAPVQFSDGQHGKGPQAMLANRRGPGVVGEGVMMRPGGITAVAAPMAMLVEILSKDLGRVVIDRTGLSSKYDFHLTWSPGVGESSPAPEFGDGPPPQTAGNAPAGAAAPGGAQSGASAPPTVNFSGPSLFTALREQLGLKLESAKGPVQVLVVDHIQPPTPD
jgi:uncharacterized protein (TIGR03435 family)